MDELAPQDSESFVDWLWEDLCIRYHVRPGMSWRAFLDPFDPAWYGVSPLDRHRFLTAMTPESTFHVAALVDGQARKEPDAHLRAALTAIYTLEALLGQANSWNRVLGTDQVLARFRVWKQYLLPIPAWAQEAQLAYIPDRKEHFLTHHELFERSGPSGAVSIQDRVSFVREYMAAGGDLWLYLLWYRYRIPLRNARADHEMIDSLFAMVQMVMARQAGRNT